MMISHWFYKVISKCPFGALESVSPARFSGMCFIFWNWSDPPRAMAEVTSIFKCPLGALENVDYLLVLYGIFPSAPSGHLKILIFIRFSMNSAYPPDDV